VLAIPYAEERYFPLVTSQSNLKFFYCFQGSYCIQMISAYTSLTNLYVSCISIDVNLFAKWIVNLKDLRIMTLRITDPFDESRYMKELKHLYVGNISSEVGDYVVKLVAAFPKVSIFMLTEKLTHLALLNVWFGGFSDAQSLALASSIRFYIFKTRHRQDYSHHQSLEYSPTAPSISDWLFGVELRKRW
jgi:hypothetical protein